MFAAVQTPCTAAAAQPRSPDARPSMPAQSPCSTSYSHLRQHLHIRSPCSQRGQRLVARMGIRAIENFDAAFELSDDCRDTLTAYLSSEAFCKQVAQQSNLEEGRRLEFTGTLFQPVPWSVQTKKGMPAEYERYLEDPQYIFINVPPNYMFKAKIFKPSRLCAIFKTAA